MEIKTFFAQDAQGNVIPSPTVFLYQPDTTTLATGLQNATGEALANPFTGGSNGQIQLAAPGGDYDLRVSSGIRDYTMRVRFIDMTSVASAEAQVAAAAAHAAAAATSATSAATSATAAGNSATDAASSQTAASASQTAAATSQAAASASATSASTSAATASTQAGLASASATSAQTSANNAALSSGAVLWVSGTTYTLGQRVISPANRYVYRRIVAGAGTTDPSADAVNWRADALEIDVGLPASRPSLLLDFANARALDPRFTFTRASTATFFDANGVLRTAAAGVPRFDHDPVTGGCLGLLIEEQRTRLNTISLLPTAPENITVTAVAHTISFYGTGTVAITGSATATMVGVGAFPARTVLTFAPTAGTLTLTPSGSVNDLQITTGAFATSVIRGEGAQVTRSADVATIAGANFSSWYRQDEGTLFAETRRAGTASTADEGAGIELTSGQFQQNLMVLTYDLGSFNRPSLRVFSGSVFGVFGPNGSVPNFTPGEAFRRFAAAFKSGDSALATNGGVGATTTTAFTPPAVTSLKLSTASNMGGGDFNGHIRRIAFYPKRLTNGQLQALTA